MPDRRPLVGLIARGLSAHTAAQALDAIDKTGYVLVRRDSIREGYLWDHGNGRFVAHEFANTYRGTPKRVGIFEMPEEK